MTNDVEASRDCYERTISFTSDAAEMHSIYLRLASIYLQEEKVSRAMYSSLLMMMIKSVKYSVQSSCWPCTYFDICWGFRLYNMYPLLSVFQCKEHLPYGLQEIAILRILARSRYSLLQGKQRRVISLIQILKNNFNVDFVWSCVLLVLTVRRACRIWGCSVRGQHSQQHRPWSMGLSFLGLFENRTSVGGRASLQICSKGKLHVLCILQCYVHSIS